MKLIDAIEIAESCDLTIMHECMTNISMHRTQMFSYETCDDEFYALMGLWDTLMERTKFNDDTLISDVKKYINDNYGGDY